VISQGIEVNVWSAARFAPIETGVSMASDGNPVAIPVTSLVHGSQAPTTVIVKQPSGNSLPPSGKVAAAPAADRTAAATKPGAAAATADIQTQVNLLNKYLNDSGRPDQFRLDPSSNGKLIQQVNPASGEVIGEFLASEFPALARSVGLSGALIDNHA
jgi:hypothetical protein